MAFVANNDENITYVSSDKLKNLTEKNEPGALLSIMDDLIRAMQQLQIMMANQIIPPVQVAKNEQVSKYDAITKENVNKQSQAAILLHQVQKAMEATVAHLSTSGRLSKQEEHSNTVQENFENKIAQMSISAKWKMYTELIQMKDESPKSYCSMKMRLGQDLGLSFTETKREMLIGLYSNRLAIVLYLKSHKNEEDVLNDIDEWERIEKARSDVFKKYRNKSYKYN